MVDFDTPVLNGINWDSRCCQRTRFFGPQGITFDLDITDESEIIFAKLVLEFEKPNGEFVDQHFLRYTTEIQGRATGVE